MADALALAILSALLRLALLFFLLALSFISLSTFFCRFSASVTSDVSAAFELTLYSLEEPRLPGVPLSRRALLADLVEVRFAATAPAPVSSFESDSELDDSSAKLNVLEGWSSPAKLESSESTKAEPWPEALCIINAISSSDTSSSELSSAIRSCALANATFAWWTCATARFSILINSSNPATLIRSSNQPCGAKFPAPWANSRLYTAVCSGPKFNACNKLLSTSISSMEPNTSWWIRSIECDDTWCNKSLLLPLPRFRVRGVRGRYAEVDDGGDVGGGGGGGNGGRSTSYSWPCGWCALPLSLSSVVSAICRLPPPLVFLRFCFLSAIWRRINLKRRNLPAARYHWFQASPNWLAAGKIVTAATDELNPGWFGTQWSKNAVVTLNCQSILCFLENNNASCCTPFPSSLVVSANSVGNDGKLPTNIEYNAMFGTVSRCSGCGTHGSRSLRNAGSSSISSAAAVYISSNSCFLSAQWSASK